jgi:hypothetical protein
MFYHLSALYLTLKLTSLHFRVVELEFGLLGIALVFQSRVHNSGKKQMVIMPDQP